MSVHDGQTSCDAQVVRCSESVGGPDVIDGAYAEVAVWAFAAPEEPDPLPFLFGLPTRLPSCYHNIKTGLLPSPPPSGLHPDDLPSDAPQDIYNQGYCNALQEAYHSMGMLPSSDRTTPISFRLRSGIASRPKSEKPAIGKILWNWGLRGHYRRIFGETIVASSTDTSALDGREPEISLSRRRSSIDGIGVLPSASHLDPEVVALAILLCLKAR